MLSFKWALRLARRWQDAWVKARTPMPNVVNSWGFLEARYAAARKVRDRLAFAAERGFRCGVANLTSDLNYHLAELNRTISNLRESLNTTRREPAKLGSWLAEVRQLEAEFDAVEIRWSEKVVRVVTDPITLRDVDLGPFAIEFHWGRLGESKGSDCFDFVALEPNPAAGRENVVHPHVQGKNLCAGEAKLPLQKAFEQGRFAEAFLIVRSVLTTYNPSSPHVRLDEWVGFPCSDCGRRVDPDERYTCEACDDDLCDCCSSACTYCSTTRCANCLDTCDVCKHPHCRACLTTTEDDRSVCRGCFASCKSCAVRHPKDELDDRICHDCSHSEHEEDITDDDVEVVEAGYEIP